MNELFNSESETAVLSILINNPDEYYKLTGLKSFMFSSNANQVLFSTISKVISDGLVPEYNLIIETLKTDGKFDMCGGTSYLGYLKSQVYDKGNLREFERLLIDSYRARMLVETSTKLSGALHNGDKVGDILSDLKVSIDRIGETIIGEDAVAISEIIPKSLSVIAERIKTGKLPGVSTGYFSIDSNTGGVTPGDVWVIGGRPGQGKSALALNLLLNMATAGNPVLMYSLEMPKQTLIERLLSIMSGIGISNIRLGLMSGTEHKMVLSYADQLMKLPIYIDTNYSANLEYVLGTTKKFHRQKGIKVVFLDYVQLMAERTENMVHEVGRICRGFKLLSNDLEIGTILLSQLNRLVEQRNDKRPILSDLRQSGDLEQDADLVGMLYRDTYYNNKPKTEKEDLEFIIRKQRNGPLGTIYHSFTDYTNLIEDKSSGK